MFFNDLSAIMRRCIIACMSNWSMPPLLMYRDKVIHTYNGGHYGLERLPHPLNWLHFLASFRFRQKKHSSVREPQGWVLVQGRAI